MVFPVVIIVALFLLVLHLYSELEQARMSYSSAKSDRNKAEEELKKAHQKNKELEEERLLARNKAQEESNVVVAKLERAKKEYAELAALVEKKLDAKLAGKIAVLEAEREIQQSERANIETQKRNLESDLRHTRQVMLQQAEEDAKIIRLLARKEADAAEKLIETLKNNTSNITIKWLASCFSEYADVILDETARWLEHKRLPAKQAAEDIRTANAARREAVKEAFAFRLRCEYYEREFPFLKDVIDDGNDSLVEEQYWDGPGSWEDQDDESARWLSQKDFRSKTPAERAQLALDRWMASRKTAWEAGVEYEDYIGFRYEDNGWKVEYKGMTDGRADLGRDLICRKGNTIHIVQCKRWRNDTGILLHENVIFQLLGSTLEYALENNCRMGKLKVGGDPNLLALDFSDEVVPVLVTTAKLSETAEKFAEALGVVVRVVEFDAAFPRIKCNISPNGNIYHLPFDQQYARVRLTKPKEGRVHTVQEAVAAGFRRAMRHKPKRDGSTAKSGNGS